MTIVLALPSDKYGQLLAGDPPLTTLPLEHLEADPLDISLEPAERDSGIGDPGHEPRELPLRLEPPHLATPVLLLFPLISSPLKLVAGF